MEKENRNTKKHRRSERYHQAKRMGLCVYCKKTPAQPDKIYCEACGKKRDSMTKRRSQEYYDLKHKNICVICKEIPSRPGRTTCEECGKRRNAQSRNRVAKMSSEQRAVLHANNATYKKNKYYENKSNGICVRCGKEPTTGTVLCNTCRSEDLLTRKLYIRLGTCVSCGKEPALNSCTRCHVCAEKHRNVTAQYIRNRTEAMTAGEYEQFTSLKNISYRNRYYERKENGICVSCGKRDARKGRTRCTLCGQKDIARKHHQFPPRSERPAHGLCYICGQPLGDTSSSLCRSCYERASNHMKELHKNSTDAMRTAKALQKRLLSYSFHSQTEPI